MACTLEPLYLENATRWLPHHKLVWQLLPLAMYAVTLWGVWWSLARAASRRAGTLVVLAMAAPAPFVLGSRSSPMDASGDRSVCARRSRRWWAWR